MLQRHARIVVLGTVAPLALTTASAAQLRVASWNTARQIGDSQAFHDVLAAIMDDDKPGFACAPHVFLFQEVEGGQQTALLAMLNSVAPPGAAYALATYTNSGEDPVGGAQAMCYRSDLLVELPAQHADIFTGAGRFADRWALRLTGYGAEAPTLWFYSAHLKASQGADNEQLRLDGVNALRGNAQSLGAVAHVIFAGDFNLYSNQEPAYQALVAAGIAQATDPFGTGSWSGGGNAIKHSQSPRLDSSNGLVGGGMDDRFDFILATAPYEDAFGLSRMPGTYRSLGNDGQHFDVSVNTGNNLYYPGELARSNALADALYDGSDHLPLLVEYRLPGLLAASIAEADLGRILQAADASATIAVWNAAPAVVVDGAETIDWTVVGSGALSGGDAGFAAPLAAPIEIALDVQTNVIGAFAGTAEVDTGAEAAGGPIVLQATGTVIRRANGSLADGVDLDIANVPVELTAGTGVQSIVVPVWNHDWTALQAALDVDAVGGTLGPYLSFVGGLATDVTSEPAQLEFAFDTDAAPPGSYDVPATITTSDEDLPGAQSALLLAVLQVAVAPGESGPPEDIDGDGLVNFNDLLLLLSAWGPCPAPPAACPADFDGNDAVDFADLLALLAAWG